eukprot:6711820-Pyramimonas_sp.AAC.1
MAHGGPKLDCEFFVHSSKKNFTKCSVAAHSGVPVRLALVGPSTDVHLSSSWPRAAKVREQAYHSIT